jgi:hypothetical protein
MNGTSKKTGTFSKIMHRGQKKVPTTANTRALLLTLSDDDHKRIAAVISHWLEEDLQKQKKL